MIKKKTISRRSIILLAVILSIVLYLAGVFSGLYANKIVEQKVDQDLDFLKSYIDLSSLDLKNIQLQQLIISSFHDQDRCDITEEYLDYLHSQLNTYWEILPYRIEEYERNHEITPDYTTLKREYIRLSLRVWSVARENYASCNNTKYLPILYFYSKDCTNCVDQGELFDRFKSDGEDINITVLVFPIDLDFEDDSINLIKRYYNVSEVPTTIIKQEIFHGVLVNNTEMKELI